jgi:hypothetical protein
VRVKVVANEGGDALMAYLRERLPDVEWVAVYQRRKGEFETRPEP